MRPFTRTLSSVVLALAGQGFAVAQIFDLSPAVNLPEVPRFSVPFTIETRIYNSGPNPSPGVTVSQTIPPGLTLLSAEVDPCVVGPGVRTCFNPEYPVSITVNGDSIQCQVGRIYPGMYRPIYLRVVAATMGTYELRTSIPPTPWETPGNNNLNYPVVVHPPGLLVQTGSHVTENSGESAIFTVQLVPSNTVPVSVEYRAVGLTATAGEDFAPVTGSLYFPAGVTKQTVAVPVLDDSWQENYVQTFTLALTNAINAEVDPYPQVAWVIDEDPLLQMAIEDAPPVPEGDGESNVVSFAVQLVGQVDGPVQVDYTADPPLSPQFGTLIFPPRATRQTLQLSFNGNLTPESNRTFTVSLAYPGGANGITLTRPAAQGTIVDDDGAPGKFHHLTMDPVFSPQLAGRPVPVTLRAMDFYGNPAANFSSTVSLGVYDFAGKQPHWFLDVSNFVAGVATAGPIYTNATSSATLGAWLWMGSYHVTAGSANFNVLRQPQLFLSLPPGGTEGDGVLPGLGRVSVTNLDIQDIVVQLTSGDEAELNVPAEVIIPRGQTSAVFNVTIVDDDQLDATHATSISATSPGYLDAAGNVSVADNESGVLRVTLPEGLSEAPGNPVVYGTVTVDRPVARLVQVTMLTSDATELTVGPALIPAGQTNGSFWISQRDDNLMDGPQLVTITARVSSWIDGSGTAVVQDNDTNLFINLNQDMKSPAEGLGTVANGLYLQLPGSNTVDVTVQLFSSDTTEAIVPASVTFPAGRTFIATNLTLVDDTELDGSQSVTLTATAPGLNTGSRTFTVLDNDPHHFAITPIPGPQTSGVPFQVRFSARDVNDVLCSVAGPIALTAVLPGRTLPVSPSIATNFLGPRGGNQWSEMVAMQGWGSNVQIRVSAGVASTLSNPFDVLPPTALNGLRVELAGRTPNELSLRFPTILGLSYQMEWSPSLPTLEWTSFGQVTPGTGSEILFSVPVSPVDPQRVYRLSVSP